MSGTGPHRWRLVRARADAVPASVRRFNRRARQRRWRAASPWLAGALVLALGGLAAWVVYGTSALGLREVRVHGNAMVSAEEVRRVARVASGAPLASVDLTEIRRRVEGLPPVRRAQVARDWPAALVITVLERSPVAVVPRVGSGYRLIDASGVAYADRADRPDGLPLVRLANPGPGDGSTRAALTVLAALTGELRRQLVAISAEAPTRVRLELPGGRQIIWGDATENEKKVRVATTLLGRPGSVIDVSAPDVVTIR
jgi:cell division protein FtsQ